MRPARQDFLERRLLAAQGRLAAARQALAAYEAGPKMAAGLERARRHAAAKAAHKAAGDKMAARRRRAWLHCGFGEEGSGRDLPVQAKIAEAVGWPWEDAHHLDGRSHRSPMSEIQSALARLAEQRDAPLQRLTKLVHDTWEEQRRTELCAYDHELSNLRGAVATAERNVAAASAAITSAAALEAERSPDHEARRAEARARAEAILDGLARGEAPPWFPGPLRGGR